MWRARVGTALLLLAPPSWTAAQQTATAVPSPGSRVRVDADSGFGAAARRFRMYGSTGRPGTLVSYGPDSLVFRPDRSDSARAVALRDIRRLYVSRGRGSRARDGVIGLVGGAASGLLAAAIMDQSGGNLGPEHYGAVAATCSIAGLGIGVAFGGAERWERVSIGVLPRAR